MNSLSWLAILTFFFATLLTTYSIPLAKNKNDIPLPELYALQEEVDKNQNQAADYQEYLFTNKADDNAGVRQARFTCDVLSFQSKVISFNHSACAVRCLSMKKKGGSCKDGICVCRNK